MSVLISRISPARPLTRHCLLAGQKKLGLIPYRCRPGTSMPLRQKNLVAGMHSKVLCPLRKTHPPTVIKADESAKPIKSKNREEISKHLNDLNGLFLHSYQVRKATVKEKLGVDSPVLLLHGDNLILKHKGTITTTKYVPDSYHLIKNIAHIACTMHTLHLLQEKRTAPSSEIAAMRENCLIRLRKILELLKDEEMPILKKHEPLLRKYLAFLEGRKTSPLLCLKEPLKALIKEAAILRTDALHKHIQKIQSQMSSKQWNHLAVIVMGPRMPREGELGMQYAQKMILKPESSLAKLCPHLNGTLTKTSHAFEGRRLIYLESIDDVDRALSELTTEICDEVLGEALLGDKSVMRADFLKDSVREYLLTLNRK